MGGGRGEDFEKALVLDPPEGARDVPLPAVEVIVAKPSVVTAVEGGRLQESWVVPVPDDLLLAKLDELVELLLVAVSQELVVKHGDERWRQAHR